MAQDLLRTDIFSDGSNILCHGKQTITMKWTRSQGTWHLEDYPFFDSCIDETQDGKFRYKCVEYTTLEHPKALVINAILKLKPVTNYSDIVSPAYFYIWEDGWPNNIGEGAYLGPYCHNIRYKWIEGAHQAWRHPTNNYYIRFDYNTSGEVLEQYCVKIYNRHLKRFKNEVLQRR